MSATNLQLYKEFLDDPWNTDFSSHPPATKTSLEMILIEPRRHENLRGVLRNFSYVLPHAALTIIHSRHNSKMIKEILGPNAKHVRCIAKLKENITRDEYNDLLTSPEFWEKTVISPKVLIFQTDTGIRYNDVLRYMEYDYVGAPWIHTPIVDHPYIRVGNGGFSLRDRSWMARITRDHSFAQSAFDAEDVFFAYHISFYDDAKVAPIPIAQQFSVEYLPHKNPMGFHKAYEFLPEVFVRKWLRDGLEWNGSELPLKIHDVWIISEKDERYDIPGLMEWILLGISPRGIRISYNSLVLPFTGPDPSPGIPKYLVVKLQSMLNDNIETIRMPLVQRRLMGDFHIISDDPPEAALVDTSIEPQS